MCVPLANPLDAAAPATVLPWPHWSWLVQVPAFIFSKRAKLAEAMHPYMTTSIKADKEANVGTITDIRLKLRDVNALKISYSTQKESRDK